MRLRALSRRHASVHQAFGVVDGAPGSLPQALHTSHTLTSVFLYRGAVRSRSRSRIIEGRRRGRPPVAAKSAMVSMALFDLVARCVSCVGGGGWGGRPRGRARPVGGRDGRPPEFPGVRPRAQGGGREKSSGAAQRGSGEPRPRGRRGIGRQARARARPRRSVPGRSRRRGGSRCSPSPRRAPRPWTTPRRWPLPPCSRCSRTPRPSWASTRAEVRQATPPPHAGSAEQLRRRRIAPASATASARWALSRGPSSLRSCGISRPRLRLLPTPPPQAASQIRALVSALARACRAKRERCSCGGGCDISHEQPLTLGRRHPISINL